MVFENIVLGKITGPKREKKQEAGAICIKRSSVICIPYDILIKLRRVKLSAAVERVGEERNT
jgi:hypothetical protein